MKEKLIKCSLCGAEMSSKSKKCPSCGGKNKKPFYKAVWFWVIIVIAVIVIGPSLSGDNEISKTGGLVKSDSTKPKTEMKTTYAIGETANLKGANVTVNKVEKSNGGEYDNPKDGYEFVIVEVTITNTNNSNITYNPYDFNMQNSQGNVTDMTWYTSDRDNDLSSGELAPGGTITGAIPFEQPINDSELTLIYEGNFWSSDKIKFTLQ